MERVVYERNKSLGRGEKSSECKHQSKPFPCSKWVLRKLAQWVTMSSFSPLDYWKNLPLWQVCMCLCWVRTWQSSFSTHFCYKEVPFVFCDPKKFLAWIFFVFLFFFFFFLFPHRKCRHCSVVFHWEYGIWGLGWVCFPTCNTFLHCCASFYLLTSQLLFSIQVVVHENIASAPLRMLTHRNHISRSLLRASEKISAELLGILSMRGWQLLYDESSLQCGGLREKQRDLWH